MNASPSCFLPPSRPRSLPPSRPRFLPPSRPRFLPPSRPRSFLLCRSRGVALLLVITVLVTLVLVAVPFAISARQGRERTTSELAKGQARFEADLLLEAMKHALGETHPMLEQQRWDKGDRDIASDPTVDSLLEITLGDEFRQRLSASWEQAFEAEGALADPFLIAHRQQLKRRQLGPLNDDRGSIWTGVVADANGLVNPNGASPFLLGNLMGAALLSEELDPSSPDIPVEHIAASKMPSLPSFPRGGGWIRIGNETIRYSTFDGSVFRGCERGSLPDTPLKDGGSPRAHEKATPVINHVAYKLATHLASGWKGRPGYRPDTLTPFRNIEDLRSIASWGGGPGITAERLDLLRSYLTVWSRRETATGWLAPQVIVNALPSSSDAGGPDELELKDQFNPAGSTAYFNPGTLLRISDGLNSVYQMVDHVGDATGRQEDRIVSLCGRVDAGYEDAKLEFEGGKATAAALAPFPININTAPEEVVYANLLNLRLRLITEPEGTVTPEVALALTQRILDERAQSLSTDPETNERRVGPFRHSEDYGLFLKRLEDEGTIGVQQRAALYFNAINPHDWQLAFGTAPWCYRTLDVYHIEARVAVNDRNGEQVATAIKQEVVEIGSDAKTAWTLDSQEDFEQRLSMGSGAKWVVTGPRGVIFRSVQGGMGDARNPYSHVQPALRAPKAVISGVYPSPERSETDERGEALLEPSRIERESARRAQHFDASLFTEGWRTDWGGAYDLPVRQWLKGDDDKMAMRPFSLSFWWRPFSDANWTALDCGTERFQNRVAIFAADASDDGQSLVFRVAASPLERRAVEIRVPFERINYEPGNWYHIHASCAGEDPSLMELLVDGVSVGRRNCLTYLAGGLTEDSIEIMVEHTEGFATIGALLVGTEVVEYDTRSMESFGECLRGARGTQAKSWPEGTPVRELGYSLPIVQDVVRGGSMLESPLGAWTAAAVHPAVDNGTFDLTVRTVTEGSGDSQTQRIFEFTGMASPEDMSERETLDLEIFPVWGCTDEETGRAFGTQGIALLGCQLNNAGTSGGGLAKDDNDRNLYGWEFVYYERDENDYSRIQIMERHLVHYERDEYPAQYGGGGGDDGASYFLTFGWREQGSGGDWIHVPAFLVPLSVSASSSGGAGEDYLDPNPAGATTDREILKRYWGGADVDPLTGTRLDLNHLAGRIAIGLPDDSTSQGVEVIRYDSIVRDKGSGVMFVRDGPLRGLTNSFFNLQDSYQDPDGAVADEPDEAPTEEVKEAERIETAREDIKPPGEGDPPEEDPATDNSGGGDDEYADAEFEYPGELIPAIRDPSQAAQWPPDSAAGASGYGEPGWPYAFVRTFRGTDGTTTRLHDMSGDTRATLVLPCFRIYEGPCSQDTDKFGLHGRPRTIVGAKPVGRNDRITFTDGDENEPQRFEARIRWAQDMGPWVALDDFIDQRFAAQETGANGFRGDMRGNVRVMKFPCGELPDQLPENIDFAQSNVSNSDLVTAMIDEVHTFWDLVVPVTYLAPQDVETDDATTTIYSIQAEDRDIRLLARRPFMTLEETSGYDEDCGLLDLDGELIIWRGASLETDQDGRSVIVLERCERGVLGTEARVHTEGAYGRMVAHWPVSYLDGRVNRDAASIPLIHTRRWWPREGCVRLVGGESVELLHYSRRTENDLILPEALDRDEKIRGRGLLRGRFGTDTIDHDSEEIVLWQPFRYWDRYMPRRTEEDQGFAGVHEHPEGSYLELGRRVRSGFWHRLTWQEGPYDDLSVDPQDRRSGEGSAGSTGFLDMIVVGRFSPTVPWDADQIVDLRKDASLGSYGSGTANDRPVDRLYAFDDPEAANALGLESEVAEFRIFFVYRPGAYLPQDGARDTGSFEDLVFENSWKRSPSLKSFTLEYTSRTSTLSRSRRE